MDARFRASWYAISVKWGTEFTASRTLTRPQFTVLIGTILLHTCCLPVTGKDIVLWRDGSRQWRCFEDFCPHRLAPLSEGRVESDGTLLCAYHAWRFDSEGNCVSIPQSEDKQTEAKHCSNKKSCAVAYPTQERQGLLWVWAESGQEAQLKVN
jgi:phenylpropionate dioxygenase-like ring-hydroxylating dioxygenase large terminal subunit